jgi:hypothetical protein
MHDDPIDLAPGARWAQLVRSTVGDASQLMISQKTKIDQGTISRWLSESPTTPSVRAVVAFARAYRLNVIDALVIAGHITQEDVKRRKRIQLVELGNVPTSELVAELGRRATVQGVA